MNTATSYYRVPAVIFAVLVGGLFVYAKSGGRFLTPAKSTPAAGSVENDPSLPRIEFMMGPKSAPAFLPEVSPPVQAEVKPVPSTKLLPGSKSAGVVAPGSLLPSSGNTVVFPAGPPPTQQQPAPNTAQPAGPRLLPGSKSIILVDPTTLQPQQSYQQAAPPTNAVPVQPARPQPAPQQRTRANALQGAQR